MEYSVREEVANAVTHGIGTLASVVSLVLLVVFASLYGDAWHIVSFSIFGASLVVLYLCSTLTHSLPHPKAKRVFEILDHAAIYFLIAGTYTPFLLVSLRGGLGWTLFGIIWGLAIAGAVWKIFCAGRFILLSTILYVGMGWIAIFVIKPLFMHLPLNGIVWMIAGGVLYTVGTIFYIWRKIPYHHAIWHTFVVFGSLCHVLSVFSILGSSAV